MRNHPLTITACLLGIGLVVWSCIPFEPLQNTFYVFIFFYGPAFLFSLAVAIYFIAKNHQYRALWLILLGPLIYVGAIWIIKLDLFWFDSLYVAGIFAAWVYLAAIKILLYPSCPWFVVFAWGSLSAVAALPFTYSVRSLGEGSLGGLWFWGLHILLWYTAVAYAMEKMANKTLNLTRGAGAPLAG